MIIGRNMTCILQDYRWEVSYGEDEMRSGINLGKIFGISVYLDWSWIFIFLLVTWNLAASVFPELHPSWGLGLNITLAIIASILFFASVLAHELAHSLVAIARGLPVRRITLFIFGGVSNIQREPDSPATEFLVAVVGPLTSIVLGVIFPDPWQRNQRCAGFPRLSQPDCHAVVPQPAGDPVFLAWTDQYHPRDF